MKFQEVIDAFGGAAFQERDGVVVHCPAHEDSKASLKVSLNEEGKALLVCRSGCTTKEIIAASSLRMSNLFDVEDDGQVLVHAGDTPEVEGAPVALVNMYTKSCAERLLTDNGADARAYLTEKCGLTSAQMADAGVGFDPGGTAESFTYTGKHYRSFPRVVIPFCDKDGIVRGAQGRDISGNDVSRWSSLTSPDGAEWGKIAVFRNPSNSDTFVVTEGPSDALTAFAHGYNAVAVRGAALASNPKTKAQLLSTLRGMRVLVAGDNDDAGRKFSGRLLATLKLEHIEAYALSIPDDSSDVSDWYQKRPTFFADDFRTADRNAGDAVDTSPKVEVPSYSYSHSDLGNAMFAKELLNGDIRHVPKRGDLFWDGRGWKFDQTNAIRTFAHSVVVKIVAVGEDIEAYGLMIDDDKVRKAGVELKKHGIRSQASAKITALITELRALDCVAISYSAFDTHHDHLNCLNGIVSLRTGEVLPHDREWFMTRTIEVEYHPDAVCPIWEKTTSEIMKGDADLTAYMQRYFGYSITGRTDEQCVAIHWGNGANGKSTIFGTIDYIFGPITQQTPFSTFELKPAGAQTNDLAALRGARIIIANEGEKNRSMAEGVLKVMSGQDKITARLLYQENESFEVIGKVHLVTNYRPAFSGQDEGLWRRINLFPYTRYFEKKDQTDGLRESLYNEAEGILAWAVAGSMSWYKSGLQTPQTILEVNEEYRKTSDPLSGFLPGVIVKTNNEDDTLKGLDVWNAFLHWASVENLAHDETGNRTQFYAKLRARGIGEITKNYGKALVGIKWDSSFDLNILADRGEVEL